MPASHSSLFQANKLNLTNNTVAWATANWSNWFKEKFELWSKYFKSDSLDLKARNQAWFLPILDLPDGAFF